MSTRRPDEVITHRIELGRWEREHIEGLLAAQTFNKVADPVVRLMSDISGMTVLAALFIMFGIPIILPTGEYTMANLTQAIDDATREWRKKKNEEYIAKRAAEGDPIEPGVLEYDPTDPTLLDSIRFVLASVKELWTGGGWPGGY